LNVTTLPVLLTKYTAILSFIAIVKDVVEDIMWGRKCKQSCCRFGAISDVQLFYVGVVFIIVILDFYNMETVLA
jgi:hypothetical protein